MNTWLPVDGYEHRYEISAAGAIRNINTGATLPIGRTGSVVLYNERLIITYSIARLVYQHFVGEIPPKHRVVRKVKAHGYRADNLLLMSDSAYMARARAALYGVEYREISE